ncbi:MAG TPA: replication protein A [Allosphingosinicella sp.]|uniref:replication protein A n=1 Tax=Allosphingosinicella sp. TaxID=2823234 RepID=UPI002ED79C57
MTARTIGSIINGTASPKARRTFQPVRRNSYHRGEREGRIWRQFAPSKAEARRIISARMRAAEAYELANKMAGKRNGPLGHVGLELLRHLYRMIDYKSGRLEPCLDTLMQRMRRSRAAIVAAMKRLKEHGFLSWIRRTEPIDNPGPGPQVRQISNAYCFGLPKVAADIVRRLLGAGPTAADILRRQEEERRQAELLASMPLEDVARHLAKDRQLQDALARLGRSIGGNASSPDGLNPGLKG